MNIGIVETGHFEVAYPLIRLFDTAENNLTIFTSDHCFRQISFSLSPAIHNYDWVVKSNAPNAVFIYRMYKEIRKRKIQLLFLSTVSDNFIFYAMLIRRFPDMRVILTLHDINTHFQFKPAFSLRRIVRNTGKKQLIRQVTEFNVLALPMVAHLRSKLPAGKKVHCLPGGIFEKSRITKYNPVTELSIVIPGSIDKKRRDYSLAFELLEKAHHKIDISICFLGAPIEEYGDEIIRRAVDYKRKRPNLRFFRKAVDQPTFDRICNEADFIFMPLVMNTIISDGIAETYGLSKSSGNIFDVIRYAKPFIAAETLKVDPYLENSCIRYETVDDIVDQLVAYQKHPYAYRELCDRAILASEEYTIEKVRSRNPDVFS